MGCDVQQMRNGTIGVFISIHAPVWGATSLTTAVELKERISIHAPVWGATCSFRHVWIIESYFNPRTRMGCDSSTGGVNYITKIFQSTHPYGVRHERTTPVLWCKQFQSTHPYGVRQLSVYIEEQRELFQSTHPYGVRPL